MGVRKEAARLTEEGMKLDAAILMSEAAEVEATPGYFKAIALGESPTPPGLKANPVQLSLQVKVVGHWVETEGETELVLLSNKNAWRSPCLLYTSPSPRDKRQSRMPSSA